MHPRDVHPGVAHVVALLADRGGQRPSTTPPNTAGTDTEGINQALDSLSTTINQIAPQLGPTFDGVTRLSRSLKQSQ